MTISFLDSNLGTLNRMNGLLTLFQQAMGQALKTMVSSNDVPAATAATKTVRRRMRKRIPKPHNQ